MTGKGHRSRLARYYTTHTFFLHSTHLFSHSDHLFSHSGTFSHIAITFFFTARNLHFIFATMTPQLFLLSNDILIPIVAIIAVFGVGGYIVLKIIQLIRDAILSRRAPAQSDAVIRKLQEFEQRHEQLVKRVQNLETIIVDADLGNPETGGQSGQGSGSDDESDDRPLRNKLV